MKRGDLFLVSAPSGAGKGTLIRRVLDGVPEGRARPHLTISHTTRQPRPGEVSGRDYHFVDRPTFERMIGEGAFLEWAEVHQRLYGTSRDEVVPRVEAGQDVVCEIDVQGAASIREAFPPACSVFIFPPSYPELVRRLASRAHNEADDMAYRLSVSLWEMERYREYDCVIINDEADSAAQALAAIILDKRFPTNRVEDSVLEILREFRSAVESQEPSSTGELDGQNAGQDR